MDALRSGDRAAHASGIVLDEDRQGYGKRTNLEHLAKPPDPN